MKIVCAILNEYFFWATISAFKVYRNYWNVLRQITCKCHYTTTLFLLYAFFTNFCWASVFLTFFRFERNNILKIFLFYQKCFTINCIRKSSLQKKLHFEQNRSRYRTAQKDFCLKIRKSSCWPSWYKFLQR